MIMKGCRSFAVRRTATGLGLLTVLPIGAGKRVIEYVGPVVTAEVVEYSRGKYFFRIDEGHAVDGSARSNLARYINHSCRPNAEAFIYGRRVWIYSKRALRAGEQITIDYGEEYLAAHMSQSGCKCEVCALGSPQGDRLS
jgi:SET domain-containing protein